MSLLNKYNELLDILEMHTTKLGILQDGYLNLLKQNKELQEMICKQSQEIYRLQSELSKCIKDGDNFNITEHFDTDDWRGKTYRTINKV